MFGVYEIMELTTEKLPNPMNLGFVIKNKKIIQRVSIPKKNNKLSKYFITMLMKSENDRYELLLGGPEISIYSLLLDERYLIQVDLSTNIDPLELKRDLEACEINNTWLSLHNIGV